MTVTPPMPTYVPLRTLFGKELISRTMVGSILLIALNTVSFGFAAWLPTFFVKQGFTVATSLGFNTLMSAGGPIGALIGLWLSDRVGRKRSIVITCSVMMMLALVYPNVKAIWLLMSVGFCLITTLYVAAALSFAIYVPELFPTEVRMRGAGLCNTAGRAMVVLTPYLVVPIFQSTGIAGVTGLMVAFLTIATITVAMFGIETKKMALEDLNPLSRPDADKNPLDLKGLDSRAPGVSI
jgi:putative MFS transporter